MNMEVWAKPDFFFLNKTTPQAPPKKYKNPPKNRHPKEKKF